MLPILEHPTDVLSRYASHCCEIVLADFLADYDAALPNVASECIRKTEQRACHTPFDGKKARCRQRLIGIAQPVRQQDHNVPIDLRIGAAESFEGRTAHEA